MEKRYHQLKEKLKIFGRRDRYTCHKVESRIYILNKITSIRKILRNTTRYVYRNFFICTFFIICVILFCHEKNIISHVINILNDLGINKIILPLHTLIIDIFNFLYKIPLINNLVTKITNVLQSNEVTQIANILASSDILSADCLDTGKYFVAAIGSFLVTETTYKHIIDTTGKIFEINIRPFYKYYAKGFRFKAFLILIVAAYIYKANLTLLLIAIGLVFYCFNVIFINDYTNNIKEGIKKGYFKYVNDNKKGRKTPKYVANKKNLYIRSEKLLEELGVYATQTNKDTKIVEKYNAFSFNIDILTIFYNEHLDNDSISIFIKQLYISMNSVYKHSENFEFFLSYYNDILNTVFAKEKEDSIKHKAIIISALIFIINKIFYKSDEDKVTCIKMLKKCRSLDYNSTRLSVLLSLNIIVFLEVMQGENFDDYTILINLFNNTIRMERYGEKEIKQIQCICKIILIELFEYTTIKIDYFENKFLILLSYTDGDFYEAYLKYEEELR